MTGGSRRLMPPIKGQYIQMAPITPPPGMRVGTTQGGMCDGVRLGRSTFPQAIETSNCWMGAFYLRSVTVRPLFHLLPQSSHRYNWTPALFIVIKQPNKYRRAPMWAVVIGARDRTHCSVPAGASEGPWPPRSAVCFFPWDIEFLIQAMLQAGPRAQNTFFCTPLFLGPIWVPLTIASFA